MQYHQHMMHSIVWNCTLDWILYFCFALLQIFFLVLIKMVDCHDLVEENHWLDLCWPRTVATSLGDWLTIWTIGSSVASQFSFTHVIMLANHLSNNQDRASVDCPMLAIGYSFLFLSTSHSQRPGVLARELFLNILSNFDGIFLFALASRWCLWISVSDRPCI